MSSEEFSLIESLHAVASLKFGNHFGDVLSYISKIKLLEATVRLLWQIMMSFYPKTELVFPCSYLLDRLLKTVESCSKKTKF